MFIYVVKPGDSLFSVSQKFNIPVAMIRMVNGLEETNIVPGQALLMNSNIYIVQPGDSFSSISQIAFVSVDALLEANPGITPENLQVGERLTIPETPRYDSIVFNYLHITGTRIEIDLINDFAPYTTYFAFFEYHFNVNGDLSQLPDTDPIQTARDRNTVPIVTITNLTAQGFNPELASIVLNNPTARQNLINNIVNLATSKGYGGVNIDFEALLEKDREQFPAFLRELEARLHAVGLILTIAIHPLTDEATPWLRGYDYTAIGAAVDLVFIMAYDWHHMASPPGPVAPIDEVRAALQFAVERIPRAKIILGVPLYGYDWILPFNPARLATGISNQDATNLAMAHGSPIQYSEVDQTPHFRYTEGGVEHEIWFEDSRSIAQKFQLVSEFGIVGVGTWQIGLLFPQGPWLLTHFFNIVKV